MRRCRRKSGHIHRLTASYDQTKVAGDAGELQEP
eukprot:SAG31_NODE_25388_length_462_cov_0.977961_1_plen_33_part_10